MSISWNKILYDEFCDLSMLNDFEKDVLRTRIQGKTITQQADMLNVSTRTIDRAIKKLKTMYDEVQPLSSKLPPRIKNSKTEEYLDNN